MRDVVGLFGFGGSRRLVVEPRRAVEVGRRRDGAPVERRLGHGEEDEERRGADQSRGDVVDVPPGVADGDEACDDDASGHPAGEKCRVRSEVGQHNSPAAREGEVSSFYSRHDGTPFVQEEDVGNRDGRDTLARPGRQTHEDSRRKLVRVRCGETGPDRTAGVQGERGQVHRSPAELEDDGHPQQIAHALHECRRREEVGDFRDVGHEGRTRRAEEVDGDVHDGHRGTRREEIAPEDRHANQSSEVISEFRGPELNPLAIWQPFHCTLFLMWHTN